MRNMRNALLSIAVLLLAMPAFGQLELDNSFETGKPGTNLPGCSGGCPTYSTDYARHGNQSMKSVVDRSHPQWNYRTEIIPRGWGDNGTRRMVWGRDYWFGFSILIPESTKISTIPIPGRKTNPMGYTIVAQIHSSSPGHGGPPWGIHVEDGKWQFQNRFGASYSAGNVNATKGQWQDVVVHMKPSLGSDGVVEVWLNGQKLGRATGPNNFSGDAIGPYLKLGVYNCWREPQCQSDVTKQTFYHDALKIASGPSVGLLDVAPWAGEPDPGPQPEPEPDPEPEPEPVPTAPYTCYPAGSGLAVDL